ncbi:TetR/AcrR family transcriptional regulator [Desulfosporosinus sp. PR]|uniref:TetR/AcrR family transcriptional regulator n=1 Tax=Candidatus Desulfosporosinus nitrosoreducens TaxID=3401928 RepID=UPI0027FA1A5C|nr:TetR/AcrR family transcriptional regulator [Desulfosporosinus sp. PR]MDQ7095085.1 TetR/AcrR family transcriptional regulator [Desulfosporosinus sp. PR]
MKTIPQEKKVRDSQKTRVAILDAAETVFAQSGFAGARIEVIAKTSGYNIGLIFRYFGDKLGLYTEVLKRSDLEISGVLSGIFTPLLLDETVASDDHQFRTLLETIIRTFFDYLLAHPHLVRILTWEMADGWQMFAKIAGQFPSENSEQFEAFFQKTWRAGLLRSDYAPKIQFSLVMQICHVYLAYLPLNQMLLSGEESLVKAREYLVNFIIAGIMRKSE